MSKNMKKLGTHATEEIRESIRRCVNPQQISTEADRLASLYGVTKSRIYDLTKDLRPKRKTRSDKGKRSADLLVDEGLKFAASILVQYNIDPAEALRTAEARGFSIPVALETFIRYLAERGLNRKNRRANRTTFRRFEAKAPGDVFQFDISGSKERWFDTKTRRIVQVSSLEISKNHPNENKNRTRVWRFVLTDDHSRRRFIRFVACDKPNSSHVVAFLLEAYELMGVPKVLYTDNDAIIKFGRNQRASQILNKALEASGGYKLEQHLPGNSRATGKVEVAHQWVEKLEKLLGLYIAEGRDVTMDVLNRFARQIEQEWNHRVHRETHQTPNERWGAQRHLLRTVDAKILKSAFLVDEFDVTILGDLTFRHKGVVYQLPHVQSLENLVHRQSKKNKVRVVFPDDTDFYTLIDFDGNEWDIQKVIATPDVLGEFRSSPDDIAERTRKELKTFARESAKAEKEANKQGYEPKPIAIIDTEFVAPATNIAQFPKPSVDVTPQILDALPSTQKLAADGRYSGELLAYFAAVKKYAAEFESVAECKAFLDTVYASREETLPDAVIKESLALIRESDRPKLRAVS
ncbi:MAG: hypothetical protein IPN69_08075 [Acidobacteria bacterium]|nr:hypothetical protein [Acidobacteriota bacterium]